MPILPINKKSFNISLKSSKDFKITIDGFLFATSLFFRNRFKLPISFIGSAIIKITQVFSLRKIKITISQVKLITKITQTISLRRVKLNLSYKERGKLFATIYGRLRINAVLKAIQRVESAILLRKVRLTIVPTLAKFFILGDYDPQTLGDLDANTLGDMDYST